MILAELSNAYVLDKPSGVATHTPDGGKTPGFVEMAAQLLGEPLWGVHRLDGGTSGCLLVTTSGEEVEGLGRMLTSGVKRYVFISKSKSHQDFWTIEGKIQKAGKKYELVEDGVPDSITKFKRVGECGLGWLYEAEIYSGKTHQIRIHAEASDVPILGDDVYGGAPFVRLMLHARDLELQGHTISSPVPPIFEESSQNNLDAFKLRASIERRRFVINHLEPKTDCFRILHREWTYGNKPKLCVEKLGNVVQVLNYTGEKPHREFVESVAKELGCEYWFVRNMTNRGSTNENKPSQPQIHMASSGLPINWEVKEHGISYELRASQGMSCGLFLDQRNNRNRVRSLSRGKSVANLFAYTCGFSVAAAYGGAKEVVSVDVAKPYIEWGKKNFEINELDPSKYEFFNADATFFMEMSLKRERKFDLIILDPPTFGRHKKGVFQLTKDLGHLITLCGQSLNKNGTLLVTINDENLTAGNLFSILKTSLIKAKIDDPKIERCVLPYDFEFPREKETVMKGFWIFT